MTLPYDIARCAVTGGNYNCPLKHHCLRRLDEGRAEYQVYNAFKGGADCDGFIDRESRHD